LRLVQRGQRVCRRLCDEIVESLVLVDVHNLRAMLAESGRGCFGPGSKRDRLDVAKLSRLGHELQCGRLELALV